MTDLTAATVLLRALADLRGGDLYALFAQLPASSKPRITSGIYPVAGNERAVHAVVGVSASTSDGREIAWTVSYDSAPAAVSGSVEVENSTGSFERLFEEVRPVTSVAEAALQLASVASVLRTKGDLRT